MLQNIENALDLVILNCDIDENTENAIVVERRQWLIDSCGKQTNSGDGGEYLVDIYRPYYVIALHYWLTPVNNLVSGESAKFDQNFEVTRRYLMRQKMLDTQMNLDVADEYQCDTLIGTMKAECLKCDNTLFPKQKQKLSIMGF